MPQGIPAVANSSYGECAKGKESQQMDLDGLSTRVVTTVPRESKADKNREGINYDEFATPMWALLISFF